MEQNARLVADEAVRFLAAKHGTTEDAVLRAIASGDEKARRQFAQLAAVGIIAAFEADRVRA